jgi:hypothetical protein
MRIYNTELYYKRSCMFRCLCTIFREHIYCTFMLTPCCCIVIDFFLNNQPDALIIQVLFCYKTLHVSGILSAHHQEFCTVHSALVSFMLRFQVESRWNCSSILTLLGSGHQKPARNLPVPNLQ